MATQKRSTTKTNVNLDPKAVKAGDLMAFIYYGTVKKANGSSLEVQNVDTKDEFEVNGDRMIEVAHSADYFKSTESVTKTAAAELLTQAGDRPFTVVFKTDSGKERILRGRLVKHDYLMGRSMVSDLDIKSGSPLRNVNHRSIVSLIINGVKYVTK